jgi:4-amino-4-deoxy-L-arabinose transferase-like glycosyltransferase
LAGAALTPVTFFLGRRMFGSRAAVITAALVAVSPALVVWNQPRVLETAASRFP